MLLLLACNAPSPAPAAQRAEPTADDPIEAVPDAACPNPADLFEDDCVIRYDLTIADADWQAMQAAYDNAVATGGAVDWTVLRTVYPATLGYGPASLDVGIRLKGNPATFLAGKKMQFRIDINRYVPGQDFHDLSSINLESSAYDPTGLKNGLALSVFDDVGLVAPAANHAQLWVNGSYYGVYENIEQINGRFLDNHYADPTGNLYWFIWNGHYGELRSNEDSGDTSDWDAMEALVDATPDTVSIDDFQARIVTLVDVDELLLAFATEAVIPQTDGVWAGSANCYMYDDPNGCNGAGCFSYLPWDLDSAFLVPPLDLCPACVTAPETVDADPITFVTGRGPAAKWRLYDLLLSIPAYRDLYVADLQRVLDTAYDPAVLTARHDAMVDRIRPYVAQDTHMDLARFDSSNEELGAFFQARRDFLEGWLAGER